MTVQLEAGMTAIRRDGERVGPVEKRPGNCFYPYGINGQSYAEGGRFFGHATDPNPKDIIAAGFPWTTLGAQVGDTVRCVNGSFYTDGVWCVNGSEVINSESLFVIVKRAAKPAAVYHYEVKFPKPADRPRAAHKLDLRDGDVVELVAWQSDSDWVIGRKFTYDGCNLRCEKHGLVFAVPSILPKGQRSLFRVISRAADAGLPSAADVRGIMAKPEPDEVFTIHKRDKAYRLTFKAGSDTGTVVREAL